MQEMTSFTWKRSGCSIVWSPSLLRPLVLDYEAVPLRQAINWSRSGVPASPPNGQRHPVLIGGLQTALESILPDGDHAYRWLRENILPLVRKCCTKWPSVGLVFGMDGPSRMFEHNEADDLVYFGRGTDREKKVILTRGMWNGAATGVGAFKLMDEEIKEIGGYYVQHLS